MDEVKAVRGPGRPLVPAERPHKGAGVGRDAAAGQRQVRAERLLRSGRACPGPAGGSGHRSGQAGEFSAVTAEPAPEHPGPGGRGERAGAGERQLERMVPGGGTLQPRSQPPGRRLTDLAEEGQGDMPVGMAGPAQLGPLAAHRRDRRFELAERRRRRRDSDEQPHAVIGSSPGPLRRWLPRRGSRSGGGLLVCFGAGQRRPADAAAVRGQGPQPVPHARPGEA